MKSPWLLYSKQCRARAAERPACHFDFNWRIELLNSSRVPRDDNEAVCKDSYDLCYCLEHFSGGMEKLAADWKKRQREKNVTIAVEILREKFASVDAFGPQQLVEFHNATDAETQAMHARRAFELVRKFLSLF